jgi:uncharacterized membrane protein
MPRTGNYCSRSVHTEKILMKKLGAAANIFACLSVAAGLSSAAHAEPKLLVDYSHGGPTKYSVSQKNQNAYEYRPKKDSCADEYLDSRVPNISFGGKWNRTLLLVMGGYNQGRNAKGVCDSSPPGQGAFNYLLVYEGKKRVAKIPVPGMFTIDAVPELGESNQYLILSGGFTHTGGTEMWASLYETSTGKLKEIKKFKEIYEDDCSGSGTEGARGSKIFFDPVVSSFSSQSFVEVCSGVRVY